MHRFVLTALLAVVLSGSLLAQETIIRDARNIEWSGHGVRTTDNCEIMFWEDTLAGDYDIWAQKIGPSGQIMWPEAKPVLIKAGRQVILAVVPSSDNNYIVLIEDAEYNSTGHLWLQKITGNGQRVWPESGIRITETPKMFYKPQLVPNSVGGAFVFFRDVVGPNILTGQNLDTWGNQLWQAGGLELQSITQYFSLDSALPDGSGGAIVNLRRSQTGSYLLRISPSGTVIGNNPLLPTSIFPGNDYSIMAGVNGEIILHNAKEPTTNLIFLHKINSNGELLLPNAINTGISPLSAWGNQIKIAPASDGGVFIAWKIAVDEGETGLRLSRFGANFEPLWTPNYADICWVDYGLMLASVDLQVHANGSTTVAWVERNDQTWASRAAAQHFDANGQSQWTLGGTTLKASDRWIKSPVVVPYADRAMFAWQDLSGDSRQIRRQVISSGGALYLAQGGEPFVQTLEGFVSGGITVAMNDRFFTAWMDSRSGTFKMHYQILNGNLEPLLEPNGRALSDEPGMEYNLKAIAMPDNSIALMYYVNSNDIHLIYLQKIAADGSRLYPGRGLLISNPGDSVNDSYLSQDSGDIYIGWLERSASLVNIKTQRISNGQKMWGEHGIAVAQYSLGSIGATMLAVNGRYFTWRRVFYDEFVSQIMTLLLNPDGSTAPGWDPAGLTVLSTEYEQYQDIRASGLIGDDLVIMLNYTDIAVGYNLAQRINPAGQRLWGDGGSEFWPQNSYASLIDAVFDDGVTFLVMSYEPSQIHLQKLSGNGTPLFPGTGNLISSGLGNSVEAKLTRYDSGYFSVAWSNNHNATGRYDVFLRHIDPQGQVLGSGPITVSNAALDQYIAGLASIGERAIVIWNDDRSGLYDPESFLTSLRGRGFDSFPVSNDDPAVEAVTKPILRQNFPNPFNPTTTISFELPSAANAALRIYNMKGQIVRTLLQDEALSAGSHSIIWDGRDASGRPAASGIYLYRLSTPDKQISRKMVLAK